MRHGRLAALALILAAAPVWACSFCGDSPRRRATMRQECGRAGAVVLARLVNPRLVPGADGAAVTDARIEAVVRPHAALTASFTVPRYVPPAADGPPLFLLFCDVRGTTVDAYQGVPVRSRAGAEYLARAARLPVGDAVGRLVFFADHLDDPDPEVAADAFAEFAKAPDAEVAAAARRLPVARVRKLVADPATPPERLGVFAYMLGSRGDAADAARLRARLESPDGAAREGFGGLLAGYLLLAPEEGWAWLGGRLSKGEFPLQQRLAAVNTLRFFRQLRGEAARQTLIPLYRHLVADEMVCDLAIEDLRRWGWWELTPEVARAAALPTHAAPIVRNGVLRYALCCPHAAAAPLVAAARRERPEVVRDLEESIALEKNP